MSTQKDKDQGDQRQDTGAGAGGTQTGRDADRRENRGNESREQQGGQRK